MYVCLDCGKKIDLEQVQERTRCPHCGYRILMKARPKTVRTVKAV